MLRIYKNQMEAFEHEARADFHDRAVAHAERRFPQQWRHLGKEQIEAVVTRAIESAGAHGFTLERTILRYLEVVFMLGSGFATDRQYRWAAQILADDGLAHETARANRLHERALEYANHAIPDFRDDSHLIAQLRRIRREPDLPFQNDFVDELRSRLELTFPNKWRHLGDDVLRGHVERAVAAASEVGLATQRGTILMVTLMSLLGSGFATDPLVPWAEGLIDSDENAPAKADALCAEAVRQLQRWMVKRVLP
jgi:hypothetical protein